MKFKSIVVLVVVVLSSLSSFGQSNSFTSSADSDPKATVILDKIKEDFNSYKSLEVDFEVLIEIPNQAVEKQNGSYIQQGEKFVVKVDDQDIYTNGEVIWLHLKNDEEIQILDYDEDAVSEIISPQQILKLYEDTEFIYTIVGEENSNGKTFTVIEFKPVSRSSEYSKLRMMVEKRNNELKSMKVFSKDGSRFTLSLNALKSNKSYASNIFVLDPKAYPDFHVEDLRL